MLTRPEEDIQNDIDAVYDEVNRLSEEIDNKKSQIKDENLEKEEKKELKKELYDLKWERGEKWKQLAKLEREIEGVEEVSEDEWDEESLISSEGLSEEEEEEAIEEDDDSGFDSES